MSESFGMTVRRTRESMDLSQMELAKMAGIAFARMSDLELGRSMPSANERSAIAQVLQWKAAPCPDCAELEDALAYCVVQACDFDEDTGLIDSCSLSAYADAMRLLARRGRLTITTDVGRRVLATINPPKDVTP